MDSQTKEKWVSPDMQIFDLKAETKGGQGRYDDAPGAFTDESVDIN